MKPVIAIFVVLTLISPTLALQAETGSVCIASIPRPAKEGIRGAGPDSVNCAGALRFKIDDGKTISWSTKESLKIDQLDTNAKHRFVVFCDHKPVQSFYFRFSDFKSKKLCLFINDLYWNLQLWESKQCPWCRCE